MNMNGLNDVPVTGTSCAPLPQSLNFVDVPNAGPGAGYEGKNLTSRVSLSSG